MCSCMTHGHVDLSIQVDFEEPLQFGEEAGDSSKAVVEALQKALNAVTCIFIFFYPFESEPLQLLFRTWPVASSCRAVKLIMINVFHPVLQLVCSAANELCHSYKYIYIHV